jgi:hypothetical protein
MVQVEVAGQRKEEDPADGQQERDLLVEAHERFKAIVEYDGPWRRNATEELNFIALDHWSPQMREDRQGLPCLTFDKISPSIDQVVNDARQNPPEAKISPVGGGADKETAEILQGLIRNIDNDSSASIAYMTGYDHAVKIGRGWWRVTFDYESEEGFEQKILIKRIPNPFSVYPDPAAEEFDYSDMRYCFVTEDLDRNVFEELYPDNYCGTGDFEGISNKQRDDWFPNGAVRVAEYWWVEIQRERMALLPDGKSVPVADVPEGTNVISTRWVERRKVHCAKITGAQVLEQAEWPGKWIPLVPCLGREIIKDGKRLLSGMIRPSMDANLSYDYLRSRQVQMIGLASLAPYLVAEGQLEGYEHIWAGANRKPYPFLTYKTTDSKGNAVGPPVRNFAQEAAIQAITIAVQHADNDCKATLSTYDASLGNAGPESSGKAILARQREGDNAHFNYHDNLGRSIQHTARIELDLAPHIYSEARIITIYDPDGSARQVAIHQPTKNKDGLDRIYKIDGAARFDVVLGNGSSYATRRKEGSAALMELARNMPGPMTRALDLVVTALDIPDGDQLAERLRPPDVQKKQDGGEVPPQQVMQQQAMQLAQATQMVQMLSGEVHKLSDIIQQKRLELESAERRTTETNLAGIYKAEISSKGSYAQTLAQLDHDGVKSSIESRDKLLHADLSFEQEQQLLEKEQQHEKEQQQTQQQHEQQMGQQQPPTPEALKPNNGPMEPNA